jgi:hypothetical protein
MDLCQQGKVAPPTWRTWNRSNGCDMCSSGAWRAIQSRRSPPSAAALNTIAATEFLGGPLSSLAFLAGLATLSAIVGGAQVWNGMRRVTFWGAVATAVTAGACTLLGAVA